MTRPKILVECSTCGALIAAGRIYRGRWVPEKQTYCPSCAQEDELSTWSPYIWDAGFKGYREPTMREFFEDLMGKYLDDY